MKNTPKKAIIIGASSGIGKALARGLIQNNYRVGVTGRRKEQLVALQIEHQKKFTSRHSTASRKMHWII